MPAAALQHVAKLIGVGGDEREVHHTLSDRLLLLVDVHVGCWASRRSETRVGGWVIIRTKPRRRRGALRGSEENIVGVSDGVSEG